MMKFSRRYAKNLELFARDNPLSAVRLENGDIAGMCFCKTNEGEGNLVDESQEPPLYLHAQEGAKWEAGYWASTLPLDHCDVIFVYGIGLGYYYSPLKNWLLENPHHYLVFLEEDLRVISHFLQTDLATEILKNPQVIVKVLPHMEPNEEGWARLRVVAAPLFWHFARLRPYMSALQSYFVSRGDFFKVFSLQWLTHLSRIERSFVEFYPFPELVIHNFYANLPYLGETIPGYNLRGALKGIPAVLCGGGPSLEKQLPLLKMLSDRVFLMASGSAMNALTRASILPHVAGAIDPTPAQASRQLTSFGYDVPAFYQNRFYDQAFIQWHGPLLYMVGSGSNRLSEWFEKELGIMDAEQIIMGVSTSNFLAEIANFLGCNPLILVGMDLAYTEDKRYPKEVVAHPLDDKSQHSDLNKREKLVISVPGVEGKSVYTTNQWFYEAVCLAAFKQRNPQLSFLNATEGGMAIPTVDNISFADVRKEFKDFGDVQGWFHGAIQQAASRKISNTHVLKSIEKWKTSLKSCQEFLNQLIDYLQYRLKNFEGIHQGPFLLYCGKAVLWQQEFQEEACYEFLLADLNTVFERLNGLEIRKMKMKATPYQRNYASIEFEVKRYQFLKTYVIGHLKCLEEGLRAYEERKNLLQIKTEQDERLTQPILPSEYREDSNRLSLQEPSLGLSLTTPFHPQKIPEHLWPKAGGQQPLIDALIGTLHDMRDGQTLYFYPSGCIKAEAFYHQGKLHGPWTFYSEEGILLFRSWFIEGKKEGFCMAYYATGEIYSVQGYVHGFAQGEHRHYFSDGMVKTSENYKKGRLHGRVRLYHSNGRLKKEQHFFLGELDGMERLWDEKGEVMMETSYESGKAIGISKKWYNGKLAKRIIHQNGGDWIEEWNEFGEKIKDHETS